MNDRKIILPLLASVLLYAACADSELPASADSATARQDFDSEVDRLTDGSSPRAIYLVANQFALGDGVEQDQQMAEKLWSRACQLEHVPSCSIYGSRLIGAGDFDAAARALETAAQAGDVDAMRNLVNLHSNSGWDGASFARRLHWTETLQTLDGASPGSPADSPTQ